MTQSKVGHTEDGYVYSVRESNRSSGTIFEFAVAKTTADGAVEKVLVKSHRLTFTAAITAVYSAIVRARLEFFRYPTPEKIE